MSDTTKSNIVQYGTYSLDAAADDRKELDSMGGGATFMKLKEGKNVVRFLPPPVGQNKLFLTVYQHYFKSPIGDSTLSFTCPRMMEKAPCPLCQKSMQMAKSRSKADKDAAREFLPRRRIMANVIDRQDPDAGPKIMGFGKTIQESLVAVREDVDAGGDFCHPDSGFDIIIERRGTGLNTKYNVIPARQDSPLGNMEWIAMQHDLTQFSECKPYEELVGDLREAVGQPRENADDPAPQERLPPGRKAATNVIDTEEAPGDDSLSW